MDIVAISKGALVTNWREINEAKKAQIYEFDIAVQQSRTTDTRYRTI